MAKPAKSKGLDVLIDELEGSLWVASVEGGRLEGLDVDPAAEQVRWGSIYWAKVARVDAAQDAVYVNLDGDNIGILYNADIRIEGKDGKYKKGGDVAIGKALQPGQMIAVQAKSGYLPRAPEEERPEDKNPRVSMNVVLSGRYLIHTPTEPDNRVSQRIRDKKLRKQLMKMLEQLGNYHGCILRAAAAGVQTDVLLREAKVLRLTWDQVRQHFKGDDPSLIMLGPDAVQRTMSDHAGKPIDRIELTTMEHFEHAEEWCEVFSPDLMTKIQPVELKNPNEELGLFDLHDITSQIDDLFQPYSILENGGGIIIQETAALVAIDVNRGADERSNLAINLQAAEEIVRHLRLRNMGGAIVIDFLRMKSRDEYKKLEEAMDRFFIEKDPCTVQIHGITKLGFMELTRQRRTPSLLERYRSVVSVE